MAVDFFAADKNGHCGRTAHGGGSQNTAFTRINGYGLRKRKQGLADREAPHTLMKDRGMTHDGRSFRN